MKLQLAAFKHPLWWLVLVLAWLLVLAAFVVLSQIQQRQNLEKYQQLHQQQIEQQAQSLAGLVAEWQKQFDEVVGGLSDTPAEMVVDRSSEWSQARALCVIPGIPEQPLDNNCWSLGYPSLVSLRQALAQQQPDALLLNAQSPSPVVLLTRVRRESGRPVSGVIAALDAGPLYQVLTDNLHSNAWVAIAQGIEATKTLVWQSTENPPMEADFRAEVTGTAWQLRYQPAVLPPQPTISLWIIPALLIVMAILAWLFERFNERLRPTRKVAPNAAFRTQLEITEPQAVTEDVPPENAKKTPFPKRSNGFDAAIFKSDGIRGVVSTQLNEQVMHKLGQAIGSEAIQRLQTKLVVGRDARLTSGSLAQALIRGLNETGCEVIDIGEVPTALLYFSCHHLRTGSGVMVTGGHHPVEYNGLKIVMDDETLSGDAIQALHQRLVDADFVSGEAGCIQRDVTADYVAAIGRDITLSRPLKVVIDGGHGIAGKVVPTLLRTLDCEVITIFCDIDGRFPHHEPNPGEPANLSALIDAVQENHADLGLAFDSGGDRLGVVDHAGQIIWPDQLLLLFAEDFLSREPGSKVVVDVSSSRWLMEGIKKAGGEPVMSASGHANITSMLKNNGAKLAGGWQGHICFADRWYGFDDALYAACRLLELLVADSEHSPSERLAVIPTYPATPEILVPMPGSDSRDFMQRFVAQARFDEAQLTTIDGLRIDFAEGWGLVRECRTQPGLILRFEAQTEADLITIRGRISEQMLNIDPTLDLNW